LTDSELVARTLGRETDAFGELVRRYENAVLRNISAKIADYGIAEDLAQDTFVTAFISLRSLNDTTRTAAWLRGIARRKALHYLSRTRLTDDLENYATTLTDSSGDIESRFLQTERRDEIRRGVAALSAKNREVAELFYFEELSITEIAKKLKIPPGTVKRRLHDARAKLKGELSYMNEITNSDFEKEVMEKIKKYQLAAEENRKHLPGEIVQQFEQNGQMEGVPFSITFTVTQGSGGAGYSLDGENWAIKKPSQEEIAEVIDRLQPWGNYFAILMAGQDGTDNPGNCGYVQTAITEADDPVRGEDKYISNGKYDVQAQFVWGLDKEKGPTSDFRQKQYRIRTNDVEQVKEIFINFAAGKAPDISTWIDITTELNLG
jgi:RNA polymerase sigma-70 factor (ECF subfamily)